MDMEEISVKPRVYSTWPPLFLTRQSPDIPQGNSRTQENIVWKKSEIIYYKC